MRRVLPLFLVLLPIVGFADEESVETSVYDGFVVTILPPYESSREGGDEAPEDFERNLQSGAKAFAGSDLEEAASYWRQALRAAEVEGDHRKVARTSVALSRVYLETGKADESEALLLRAIELQRQHPEEVGLQGESLQQLLALFYEALHRYADAEEIWLRLLEDAKRLQAGERIHRLELDLARHYSNAGSYDSAGEYAERGISGLSAFHANADREVIGELQMLAIIREQQGDYEAAARAHKRRISAYKTVFGQDDLGVAAALEQYGAFLRRSGQENEAEQVVDEAAEIRRAMLRAQTPDP